ncbi:MULTISPECIES: glycosyltransferase [Streptomyces]|uniref:UDP:flavonoid glycosyltransferase YjiC (YdhE family) n=1 Tax=Streptomyces demainii TaxID=588122 RepID=A0ABT9L6R3_9ACTN|nr:MULTISPECIES: glycosyltransferase [Streptomyces]MDN3060077.1 glycosyltransferase [Streptomyces sp. SRF1]MDP9616398.1 UDP:flavonoid glycosyltransferase YjiC (YdhE family) [Streptomyces demainii]
MRILLLTFYHGLGHVVRCARVGAELAAAGAEVLVGTAEPARHIVAARGLDSFAVTELPPFPPRRADEEPPPPAADGRIRLADPDYLATALAEERAAIREFGPDLVIVDFRVTGAVSAALEGVPAAWIVNTGFFSFPFPQVVRDVVPELERLGVPPETARRILGDVLYIPDWSRFDPLSGIDSAESGAALRSLIEIRHVGPVLKESPARVPSRAEARKRLGVEGDDPLVYVSLGGTAQGFATLCEVAPRLGRLPARTVLVTGPNIPLDRLPGQSADLALGYTEDSMLWTRAADLVVTHAGHTSTMEALCLGTPLLAIPGHAEQQWNASRAVTLGAGEILPADAVADGFLPTAERLLSDRPLADRARDVASVLGAHDGATALASHALDLAALAALERGPR